MPITGIDIKARDIMIGEVITISPESSVHELIEVLRSKTITGVPVVDKDNNVVGVVSVSDILRDSASVNGDLVIKSNDSDASDFCTLGEALQFDYMNGQYAESIKNVSVKDIMRPFSFSVEIDANISDVANTMYNNRLHRILVMNKGKMAGIICTREFIKLFVKD